MALAIQFDCPLVNGLHARPATTLANVCGSFTASVQLTNHRNGLQASARSVLALISADVRFEDSCDLNISGEDAALARDALQRFIDLELAHCDDDLEPALDVDGYKRPVPRSLLDLEPQLLQGLRLCQGIAVADAMVVSGARIPEALVKRPGTGIDEEWQQIVSARAELSREYENALSLRHGTEAEILRAHLAIIGDEEFSNRLHQSLHGHVPVPSAAAAISATVQYFDALLGNTGNPYLLERALDIQDISMQMLRKIYGENAIARLVPPDRPVVLVAAGLTPSDFIAVNNGKLRGLVLESGGQTSHTAILARAAGIPAITAVPGALAFASASTEPLAVDANNGLLVRVSSDPISRYYASEKAKHEQIGAHYEAYLTLDAATSDGRRIEVAANIALAPEAGRAFSRGAEGIGLFRTEMLFMEGDKAPTEQQQFEQYREALVQADGRPVIVRTFDIGGDKPVAWMDVGHEDNPFLGMRAVRLYKQHEQVFRTQLRALIRAAGFGDLRIMIPMISSLDELRWVKAVYQEECEAMAESDTSCGQPMLGIMLEVPSAASIIDQLAEYCDFISIGSNDLAQYFLACDRGNPRLETLYSHYQPSFLRLLKHIVSDAHEHNLWVGLCGEMAAEAEALPLLAGLGLDEISMSAPEIARSKAQLATLDSKSCEDVLERCMACPDELTVRDVLREFVLASEAKTLIDERLIEFNEGLASKAEAIKKLVDVAHLGGRTVDAALLEEAIWQREDVFSTGLGFGFAIPHCKSEAVLHASLCIARLDPPIDWGSRDGQAVDMVMMLIIPDRDGADEHLKIFAQLARKIMHAEFRDGLRDCADAASLAVYLDEVLGATPG